MIVDNAKEVCQDCNKRGTTSPYLPLWETGETVCMYAMVLYQALSYLGISLHFLLSYDYSFVCKCTSK